MRAVCIDTTSPHGNAVSFVEACWALMASNDFLSVGAVLADDFVLGRARDVSVEPTRLSALS